MFSINKIEIHTKKYLRLSLLIFIIFFLIIKSPFNRAALTNNLTSPELSFFYFEFYIYLAWGVLFFSLYNLLYKRYAFLFFPFLIWNFIFILLSFTYNLGFDLTDEGWQLAKSWGFFHGSLIENSDLIWGSTFVNGIWMALKGTPSVLWSRIGFLFLIPFYGVVIYLILKEFYNKKISLISTAAAFLLYYRFYLNYNVVNYYYLPVFVLLLSFLFFTKFHNSTNSKSLNTNLIISAFLAGISIHLKFTFILFIPFFAVYLFLSTRKNRLTLLSAYYVSMLSALISGFIILYFFGGASELTSGNTRLTIQAMIKTLFGQDQVNSSLNYSFKYLFSLYLKDIFAVFRDLPGIIIPVLIASITAIKQPNIKPVAVIFIGAYLTSLILEFPENHLIVFEIIFTISLINLFFNRSKTGNFLFIPCIMLCVFGVSFIGSGLSLFASLISLGFFGFTAYAICSIFDSKSETIDLRVVFYSILIVVFFSQTLKPYSPYRDLPAPYLNTMFKSPELSGIYSFKERVEVVDDFMDFAKKENIREDKVIFVAMPMFYFLLDIKPVISETHDVILGFEQLKKEVIEAEPDVIVMPVQSPRGQLWPLLQNADFWTRDGFERQTAHFYEFYREYIKENNYNKIFENAMFIAYRKSDVILEAAE